MDINPKQKVNSDKSELESEIQVHANTKSHVVGSRVEIFVWIYIYIFIDV